MIWQSPENWIQFNILPLICGATRVYQNHQHRQISALNRLPNEKWYGRPSEYSIRFDLIFLLVVRIIITDSCLVLGQIPENPDTEIDYQIQSFIYLIRRVVNLNNMKSISLCRFPPLGAEFQLKYFIRAHFISNFDQTTAAEGCVSVSLICFIDGFNVFRNRQRSLMGIYEIIASFFFRERARRANVLPLTLGPHGSNIADVVDTFHYMASLDENIFNHINDEEVFLCAFHDMYVGDMPQQQENSGFKSQKATPGRRFCFIVNTYRDADSTPGASQFREWMNGMFG